LVALKKLFASSLGDKEFSDFCRDIRVLAFCDNPFIVPILAFTDSYPDAVVTPYIAGRPLSDVLGHSVLNGTAKPRIAISSP
jgi:hypothetical protein